ncbi:MAG: hypothetical protein AMXMBFR84_51040 [Candidatus Hydrogenedentota bacterium]
MSDLTPPRSSFDSDAPWLQDANPEELRRIVDALYRVHRFVNLITDLDTLLKRIMEESKEVAQAEACSLMLYDPVNEELYFQVALGERGDQEKLIREVRLTLDQGIAGAAATSKRSINVKNAQQDARFFSAADATTQFETRSILAVPLVEHDTLIGVLEVLNKVDGDAFSDLDLRVMEIFSGVVATVLANARLIDENLKRERLAAIGQAVAGLSHYTKNIITGMSSSVDLIDQGLTQGNLDFLMRSWPIFKRSTKRIANFVEDMLAYSKPRKPVYEECTLQELIQEVTETFWALLTRKEVDLRVDLSEVHDPILVDARGLFRCLLNLMTNAADAVPKQGGIIRISASVDRPSKRFVIEVADNGLGVPEENRRRIYEPFFSTKGTQGTGLGLAVTRKIIQEHEGDILVTEAPEGGALFRVLLPLKPVAKVVDTYG